MNHYNAAALVLIFFLAELVSGGQGQEHWQKAVGPVKPSARIDFSPLDEGAAKSKLKGKAKLRMVVVATDGTTYDQTAVFDYDEFGRPGLAQSTMASFGFSMRKCGGGVDKGFECEMDVAGLRLTVTGWKAGNGRTLPIKSVWIGSPNLTVPAANMPVIKVAGGVKIAPPPSEPQKMP